MWDHVRAASNKKIVHNHCSCEPISLPNSPPEKQSIFKNVSKAYKTITLKRGTLPGLFYGRYALLQKFPQANIIFFNQLTVSAIKL